MEYELPSRVVQYFFAYLLSEYPICDLDLHRVRISREQSNTKRLPKKPEAEVKAKSLACRPSLKPICWPLIGQVRPTF